MMRVSGSDFVSRYGGVYEHSAWVAERAAPRLDGCNDPERIAAVMAECVDDASRDLKLELIRAHPDLVDRARLAEFLRSG